MPALKKSDAERIAAALERSAVFGGCGDEKLRELAESGGFELVCCEAGEDILPKGGSGSLGVVVSGSVRVSREDESHRVTLNLLGAGDCFGASTMFASDSADGSADDGGENRAVTRVEAVKRAEVAFLGESRLRALLVSDEAVCMGYIAFLTDRIRFLNRRLHTFSGGTTAEKVAKLLLSESGGESFAAVNLAETARRLNIGRASLYRALDAMEESGVIRREEKRIVILDRQRLERMR